MNAVTFVMGEYVTRRTGAEGSKADKRLGKVSVSVALVKCELLRNTFKLCSALWYKRLPEFANTKHADKI